MVLQEMFVRDLLLLERELVRRQARVELLRRVGFGGRLLLWRQHQLPVPQHR